MTTDTTPTPAVADETIEKTPAKAIEPSTFRMVALDLDGTLLNSRHKLSETTIACLRRLHQEGFRIVIATGRAITTVYEVIRDLNLPHPIPVVCSNGAQGYFCQPQADGTIDKELLFSTPVPLVVAQKTAALSKELGVVCQTYIGEDIWANPRAPHHYEKTELYMELTGSQTRYVQDDFEAALNAQGLPSKQLVLCRNEEQDFILERFQEELAQEPYLIDGGKRATIVRGNLGWFLEILHPLVNKGNGLKRMCDHLNQPIEQCLAFGDGDNDVEFLQMAGKGYAMKNARDVVKDITDEVIPFTNDEDGVAMTLMALEEQGCLLFER
jgi:Cof subfamily protein (haloacid dehalogenase superfamily)